MAEDAKIDGGLRDWLGAIDAKNELVRVNGVDPNLEIGEIVSAVARERNRPALLFENIKGDASGSRILANALESVTRLGHTLGLTVGPSAGIMEIVQAWRRKATELQWQEPIKVDGSPVLDNVMEGRNIDLSYFPTPKWHPRDGGRYLGTGCAVVTRDRESGQVNLGTYRVMVVDDSTVTVMMESSRDGSRHLASWFRHREASPVAVVLGAELAAYIAASLKIPPECPDEYWFAGAINGRPMATVRGPWSGLPLPASAELVLEGECIEGDELPEGPFGEWTGYYGRPQAPTQAIRLKRVLFRDHAIILGRPPIRPPSSQALIRNIFRSALAWNQLEKAGVSNIRGVWFHEAGGDGLLRIVSLTPQHAGHSVQAAQVLLHCSTGLGNAKYVIVVDDDVDPTNLEQVMWAVVTRSDPSSALTLVAGLPTSPLDPSNAEGQSTMTRVIIDACRPIRSRAAYPAVLELPGAKSIAALKEKWPELQRCIDSARE